MSEMTKFTGRVKWFNNKAGYGFIETLNTGATAATESRDLFVHFSGISADVKFAYLVQGEYVEGEYETADNDKGYKVSGVTGVQGGKLMCQTRLEMRESRQAYAETRRGEVGVGDDCSDSDQSAVCAPVRPNGGSGRPQTSRSFRQRGDRDRDGGDRYRVQRGEREREHERVREDRDRLRQPYPSRAGDREDRDRDRPRRPRTPSPSLNNRAQSPQRRNSSRRSFERERTN